MSLHGRSNGRNVHPIHRWTAADQAAREAITTNPDGSTITVTDGLNCLCLQEDTGIFYRLSAITPITWAAAGASSSWGNITGTLANQTDLQTALNGKSSTAHTHTGTYEPVLGNPAEDGQILSSTAVGARLWIDPPSGGGGLTWTTVSTNTTVANNTGYFVDTSSATVTLTLPASMADGFQFGVIDLNGTFDSHSCVIANNSHSIMGTAENMEIDSKNFGGTFVYHLAEDDVRAISSTPMAAGAQSMSTAQRFAAAQYNHCETWGSYQKPATGITVNPLPHFSAVKAQTPQISSSGCNYEKTTAIFSGNHEFACCVLLPNGHVLLVPHVGTTFKVFDPIEYRITKTSPALPTLAWYFFSATLLPNGWVFCPPGTYVGTGYIYDHVRNLAWPTAAFPAATAYRGTLMGDEQTIFCVSSASVNAQKYNYTTGVCTEVTGTPSGGFTGAVLMADNRIFCVPVTGTAAIYDPDTNTFSTVSGFQVSLIGGVLLEDGRVFCTPSSTTSGNVYNPSTNTVTTTCAFGDSGTNYRKGGVLLPDGRVFVAPTASKYFSIYNPYNNTVENYEFTTTAGTELYASAILLPNGRVFCSPKTATQGMFVQGTFSNSAVFDPKVLLGPYMQHG